MDPRKTVALVMAALAVIVIVLGIASMDIGTLINAVIIAFLICFIPFLFYKYSRFMWIKAVESQFPGFLRDVADLIRSGMSFQEAIQTVSKNNYGKLSDGVKAMANRLSWGTPFMRVLEIFGNSVSDSKIITEVLHIIRESYHSGGNVAATLDSVAENVLILKEAEAERTSITQQQVGIIYGIFFMFIAITIIITTILVPMVSNKTFGVSEETVGIFSTLMLTFKNPCETGFIFPCPLYSSIGMMLGLTEGIGSYYVALFFLTIIIEGAFLGLIAGQLSSNSISAGLKHSFIMVLVGMSIFIFLAKAGFLAV